MKRKAKEPTKVILFGKTFPLELDQLWRIKHELEKQGVKIKKKATIRQLIEENGGIIK